MTRTHEITPESAPTTGSIARGGAKTEGQRTRGWLNIPVLLALTMLVATYLHLPLADMLPNKTFVGLLVVLIIATAVWIDRNSTRLRGIGPIECAMALYLLWNVYSMFAVHKYEASRPLTGEAFSVARFIMIGTVIPFVMYVVGRYAFDRAGAVRALLWTILAMAAYSAWVSILPVTGPQGLVWPRFIVDGSLPPDETWIGRAIGVFNQPVVNGLTLALGFAVALILMGRRSEPAVLRWLALIIGVACVWGIYLTHTRAAWLSGAIILIVGAVLARGHRTPFVAGLGICVTIIAVNWSVFTSSDREAGGVGSTEELEDRLNTTQTSLWAIGQRPVTGWGIGRFQTVNTFHHQQWSPETPWIRGYGIASHGNELGIFVELGAIGLMLWIAVLALIAYRLWDAFRTLPSDDLCGKPLALLAIIAMITLVGTGLTVDLRFFELPPATTFLLIGIAIGWSDRHKQAQAAADDLMRVPVLRR